MPGEFRSPIKYIYQLLNRPVEELKKLGLGGGIESVQPGTGIDIDDADPLNPIINVVGDGTSNLQSVTDLGNTTTNDIVLTNPAVIAFDSASEIIFNNNSRFREGTIDAGLGGARGIAQICAVGYELKWEAGRLYIMDGNGRFIRSSLYNFNITPTANDDVTKGYLPGSLWTLDDGTTYVCTDETEGAAVWEPKTSDYIPLRGTNKDADVTGPIGFSAGRSKGGSIIFKYRDGNVIELGGQYDDGITDYPTIRFFDASITQTLQLYMRGGDLILQNDTLGTGTSSIIQSFDAFNNQRVIYGVDSNPVPGFPNSDAGRQIISWNNLAYISNGGSTIRSWTPVPTYYFSDSCSYTQIGTSAPTEDVVFETQVGGLVTKRIDYVGIGVYSITYNVGLNLAFMPQPQKVKVVATSGNDVSTCVISAQVSQTSIQTIQVYIYTRGNSGNANGLLKNAFIDVYWYK